MIEENTLLRWAAELVAFANSERGPREYYTAMYEADFWGPEDMADHYAHKVPDEERTQDQIADTHKLAFRNLKALSECKRSALPDALLREAKQWLASPAVRSSNKANTFTPMDAVFSLDANGAIQMTPRMRNEEAQFALTFAELIQKESPVQIKRCDTCGKFFVWKTGKGVGAGRPRNKCERHHNDSKLTHRKIGKDNL